MEALVKWIEFRIHVKDEYDIEEIAEQIKDILYDDVDEENLPIRDITYKIKTRRA